MGVLVLGFGLGIPAFGQLAPTGNQSQVTPADQNQFNKIYEVDADGMPTTPSTWVDLAALTANHTISADQRGDIEAGVLAWMADLQTLVLENPDLALEAANGLFEDVDLENQSRLMYASEVMRTLASMTNMTAQLATAGVLTNEQGEMNRRITQDYSRAMSEAIAAKVTAEVVEDSQRQMQMMMAKMTMASLTHDARLMFESVAVRGAPHARAALEQAGLDASNSSSELAAVNQAGSDEEKVKAMVELMNTMETIDLIKFAKALGEKLPPLKLPEMAKVGTATAPPPSDG